MNETLILGLSIGLLCANLLVLALNLKLYTEFFKQQAMAKRELKHTPKVYVQHKLPDTPNIGDQCIVGDHTYDYTHQGWLLRK